MYSSLFDLKTDDGWPTSIVSLVFSQQSGRLEMEISRSTEQVLC